MDALEPLFISGDHLITSGDHLITPGTHASRAAKWPDLLSFLRSRHHAGLPSEGIGMLVHFKKGLVGFALDFLVRIWLVFEYRKLGGYQLYNK